MTAEIFKHEYIITFVLVYKNKVKCYVAVPVAFHISCKFVVMIGIIKRYVVHKFYQGRYKSFFHGLTVTPALFYSFFSPFEIP